MVESCPRTLLSSTVVSGSSSSADLNMAGLPTWFGQGETQLFASRKSLLMDKKLKKGSPFTSKTRGWPAVTFNSPDSGAHETVPDVMMVT